jgi:putative tryptophan/tyrosine transport system substrate-binding protein
MRRREFIAGLGSALTCGLVARARPSERVRRIGILWPYAETDPEGRSQIASMRKALLDLGWSENRNLRVDYRWGASAEDRDRIRRYAMELLALAPDVIVAGSGGIAVELRRMSHIVPIVFPTANDPVGVGLVESLERPGGNATGFAATESGHIDKFLELLRQIAPNVTRVAVIRNPTRGGGIAAYAAIEAAASPLGVEVIPIDLRDVDAIERGVALFAGALNGNGGLIVPPAALATTHRDVIVRLAGRYRLPAIYPLRIFVTDGGLISYGAATIDLFPRVADYINRILNGTKPGDLPVQPSAKIEMVLNAKTAMALGLSIPEALLSVVDEVIR